jgi:hypothetical protein
MMECVSLVFSLPENLKDSMGDALRNKQKSMKILEERLQHGGCYLSGTGSQVYNFTCLPVQNLTANRDMFEPIEPGWYPRSKGHCINQF